MRKIFLAVPVGVLLAAFAGICILTGTAWPWNEVVHEDGHRTLIGTVFYFEHALRELVPDTVLAIAVAGAVRYFFPVEATGKGSRKRLAIICLVTVLAIIGGTIYTEGLQSIGDNLAQLHTREGAPLVWGAHWRYHLISSLAQMMLAFALTGIVWLLHGRPDHSSPGRAGLYVSSLAAFALLTIVFRPSTEPFRDPAFLGHQLRELFTHALVTVPLALGVCLSFARRSPKVAAFSPRQGRSPVGPIAVTAALAILSGAFLLAASLMTGAQSHGQTSGLAHLLLPHFFEHALGYLFVPALAGWLYLGQSSTT